MRTVTTLAIAAISPLLATSTVYAQTSFGSGCAGASGVTPTMAVSGIVKSGSTWTLEVTAPGGIGLGYLAIGFSNTTASAIGGLPLPLDLGVLFGDPLWSGCTLNVDPSYALQPYAFDPNASGGLATFTFPGFDFGTVYMQAINIDADFVTRIAGVSRGLAVLRTAPPRMAALGPGSFEMGSSAPGILPYLGANDTKPVHVVTITYPFWIGQFEVTQAEYVSLMGSNPSTYVGADRPVEMVSWDDAMEFCAELTAREALAGNLPSGYEYRLPTEAEWEYACRAGTTTEFNVGVDLLCSDARFIATYHPHPGFTVCDNPDGHTDVGSFQANAWGLHDMHGNVNEWCLDSFASYGLAPQTDPLVTGGPKRVVRGGGWANFSPVCTSANRYSQHPWFAEPALGFRAVLGPIQVQ